MVQIDFYDRDIVSTLLPISSTKPERVVFLIDKRKIEGKEPENIARAIKNILPETQVSFEPVTIDDLSDIYNKLVEVVEGIEDTDDACIDLTGGTELMSACGYRVAREYDILPLYVDVKREHVINAETGEIINLVTHIDLESYLTAIGAKRLKDSHEVPKEEEFERILAVSQIIFSNVDDWQLLCQHIAKTVSQGGGSMKFRIPEKIGKNKRAIKDLINGFCEYGFIRKLDDNEGYVGEYIFTDKKSRSYMTTFGTWLELFIYIKALDIYDEAELGVVIDWQEGDHFDTQDNEIDVVAMRKSLPIFISCKMRKPVSGDLYEIGFLASRFGGTKAKALLATTYPVKEMGISPKRMYQRMKKLRVGLVEAERFNELPSADVFNQAVQMTE